MGTKAGGCQRRHSALRTIKGGICLGLTLLLPCFTQLLSLGYQVMVNSAGFNSTLSFFSLANITVNLLVKQGDSNHTHLLSANWEGDFRQIVRIGLSRSGLPGMVIPG